MILQVASAALFGRQILTRPKDSATKSKPGRYGSIVERSRCPRETLLVIRKAELVVSGDGMDYIHTAMLSAFIYINKCSHVDGMRTIV